MPGQGSVVGRVADMGYAAGWRVVRATPPSLALGAFQLGADLVARRGGPGARQLRANLARVVPGASPAELDALVRQGMQSYGRYWCEVFRLPSMDPVEIHARMDPFVSGSDSFFEALGAGRGVVFALPHGGNWDVAGIWLVQTLRLLGREAAFTTVTQRLRPESLYRRFVAYRSSLGFEVVAAQGGAATYRALTRRLRGGSAGGGSVGGGSVGGGSVGGGSVGGGGVVCLVADRDLSATGIGVTFLGEPTRFPAGPARLAAMTGALLLPAFPRFTPDGWALSIAAPVPVPGRADVPAATQAVADAFGELIATAPQDWHALQPIWTADGERAAMPA